MNHDPNATDNPHRDRNAWCWGFTPQAEIWNGRLAMVGFVCAMMIELLTGQIKLPF